MDSKDDDDSSLDNDDDLSSDDEADGNKQACVVSIYITYYRIHHNITSNMSLCAHYIL